jgi:hypothetical protein
MMFYALVIAGEVALHTVARDRADALKQFAKKLGYEITEKPKGDIRDLITDLMLDEWEDGPHWIHPTIPVFRKR